MRTGFTGSRKASVSMLLILAITFGTLSPAWAFWVTVGSAGTVDAADTNIVAFDRAMVLIADNAPLPATLNMRYNVLLREDNPTCPHCQMYSRLAVRFLDNGSQARIIVRLKQYHITTGVYSTVATFDSDTFPASPGTQLQQSPCLEQNTYVNQFAYWIEADVIKTSAAGDARLGIVHVKDCNG